MKGPIRNIVAATDFSATSEKGLSWARELAERHDATLHLAHALFWTGPPAARLESPRDFLDQMIERARRAAEERAEPLRESVTVETHVEAAEPSEHVVAVAGGVEADLVVVGSRGLTGLRHLLLGSTAEKVVRKATCPVLTVHPEDPDGPADLSTVLVPTDFSNDAEAAAKASIRTFLQAVIDARVVLLHVHELPGDYMVYGPAGPVPSWERYHEAAIPALESSLEQAAEPLRREGLHVETLLRTGQASTSILEEAETWDVQLVAMGTAGRTGLDRLLFGSTAQRVVQHAACPVLTVRCAGS